jgi:hypothetical protein
MPQSIFYFPFIAAAVRPLIVSLSSYPIISKLAFVDDAVGPDEGAFSMEESIVELSIISVAVFEGDFGRSVETLAVYFTILG